MLAAKSLRAQDDLFNLVSIPCRDAMDRIHG